MSYWFRAAAVGLLLACGLTMLPGGTTRAEEPGDLAARIKAAKAAFGKEREQFEAAFEKAKTDKERERISDESDKALVKYVDTLFKLVEPQPANPAAFDALVTVSSAGGDKSGAALDLIAKHHAAHPDAAEFAYALAYSDSPRAETVLRAIAEQNKSKDVKGVATYALGVRLKHKAKAASDDDRAKLAAEAEGLLKAAASDYATVKTPQLEKPLGVMAAGQLAGLKNVLNLVVGKTVPEIEGEDTTGKALKLSDARGKVVLLDFWASWCGPCMGMVPHNKKIVARMKDKPFTLIGVNGDPTADDANKAIGKHEISWRSFKSVRGADKPELAEEWNLDGWPTLYLIDHKGVIRSIWLGSPGDEVLDKEIDKLVAAAEADAKK
ncbi:TlpA family protein disulfide reductase [Fimbriiglobus ruber]|uniref:Thioredoxin family protein n=1 Tax=Fimbriiglobus ruber TaxID=1908690 RepID=A0A225DIG2_9BACT|nr:TlpA disulfide reductase family protein [Fimbriiglobus ruber]OWK40783.1 thioredoxin family protein [Fimbriiglobus ruber]